MAFFADNDFYLSSGVSFSVNLAFQPENFFFNIYFGVILFI